VRPLAPRLTPRTEPPAGVGRSFAYGSTNPGHPQLVAAVTESPIPTTTEDPGVEAPLHPAIAKPTSAAANTSATARPGLRSRWSLTQPTMATSNGPGVAPRSDHCSVPRSSAVLVWTSRSHPHYRTTMACESTSGQEEGNSAPAGHGRRSG